MALINPAQLIGKTFYTKKPLQVYSVKDLNDFGDKAKPISTMPTGSSFVMDSFLAPVTADYISANGIHYAKRKFYYFTFFSPGPKYNAVIYSDDAFSFSLLAEQGTKTVAEEIKEKEEANKTDFEKISDKISSLFGGIGSTLKTLLIIGLVIYGIGYLAPKFIKK